MVGEPFPEGTFHEALKNGIFLCKAVKQLDPSVPIKYNDSKAAFKMVSMDIIISLKSIFTKMNTALLRYFCRWRILATFWRTATNMA